MFSKLTKCISTGISNFADFSQSQLLRALSKKYPDFLEVLEVLESIDGPQNVDEVESPDDQDDGRWHQMLLTIGTYPILFFTKKSLKKVVKICLHF